MPVLRWVVAASCYVLLPDGTASVSPPRPTPTPHPFGASILAWHWCCIDGIYGSGYDFGHGSGYGFRAEFQHGVPAQSDLRGTATVRYGRRFPLTRGAAAIPPTPTVLTG